MERTPLSEYDCDAWRTRLDTLMHDATLATTLRWGQEIRALATIDHLHAVNKELLKTLGALPANPRSLAEANDAIYAAKLRAAIKAAKS